MGSRFDPGFLTDFGSFLCGFMPLSNRLLLNSGIFQGPLLLSYSLIDFGRQERDWVQLTGLEILLKFGNMEPKHSVDKRILIM